jgi:hypothetical protein
VCHWIHEHDFDGWVHRNSREKRNVLGTVIDNDNEGNYLCIPRNAPYKFHWLPSTDVNIGPDGINYGANKASHCLKIYDPEQPSNHYWNDNYLCAVPTSSVVDHACIPCDTGKMEKYFGGYGSTSKNDCLDN